MPRDLVYFPESALVLDEEIKKNHPALANVLAQYPNRPLEVKIAAVAAYCNIMVDGYFTENDLKQLIDLLLKKLQEKSAIFVDSIPPSSTPN